MTVQKVKLVAQCKTCYARIRRGPGKGRIYCKIIWAINEELVTP